MKRGMRFNSDTYSSSGMLYHQSSKCYFFLPSYMTDTRFQSKLGGCGTDDSLTFGLNGHKETKYRAHVNPELVLMMVHTQFPAGRSVKKPEPQATSMLDALTGLTDQGPGENITTSDAVQRSIDTELCSTRWTYCCQRASRTYDRRLAPPRGILYM